MKIIQIESRVEKTKHSKTQQKNSGTRQKLRWKKKFFLNQTKAKEQNKN